MVDQRDGSVLWDEGGAAAVEFALITPILLLILVGILSYGGYFWTAHSVQQLANDSARAAIAGLTAQERQEIAEETVAGGLPHYALLTAAQTTVEVEDAANRLAINVAFDASDSFFFVFSSFIPMPPATITRAAAVQLGGY